MMVTLRAYGRFESATYNTKNQQHDCWRDKSQFLDTLFMDSKHKFADSVHTLVAMIMVYVLVVKQQRKSYYDRKDSDQRGRRGESEAIY